MLKIALLLPLLACTLAAQNGPLTDEQIINLHKGGLTEDELLHRIASASSIQFDLTPSWMDYMLKSGVSENVIKAMAAKEKGQPFAEPKISTLKRAANPMDQQGQVTSGQGQRQLTASPAAETSDLGTRQLSSRTSTPRVYLDSASKGTNRNAARNQSMEMSKDLERDCPGVRVTINQQIADYTILLNHIEVGLVIRDNQIQVANRDGDLITRTKEGGSIAAGIRRACKVILDDWSGQH